ncbi:MAG TPA: LysM peptidoglycan-binding domain-containing protein [Nitratifractor sp.]|nr:LysM peptidoglycan-binding domain-containing protein [Nitratifractor sp.]
MAKSKAAAPKSTSATPKATVKQDDAALAAALESAQTDTLKNEKTAAPQKLTGNVKAGSNKKVDTFNKVVVGENGGGDDELSKLSQEIDSILQSDEVAKNQTKETVKLKKELKAEAETRQAEMRFIVVKKGDTLSSIANRAYGRASAYTKIYAANPDIVRNPNRIYVGMRLRVPVDQEYKNQQGK